MALPVRICGLRIIDGSGRAVYAYKKHGHAAQDIPGTAGQAAEKEAKDNPGQKKEARDKEKAVAGTGAGVISKSQAERLKDELERTGVTMKAVGERYHYTEKPEEMPQELYEKVMRALARTKTRDVA